MVRFLQHRIGDRRVIRLIQKWLKAGVLDGTEHVASTAGTPQGAVISPLLANVYLHYAYDLWVKAWRKRHATGDMIVVRYADDTIVGFQHQADAERFLRDLSSRLATFALELHPDKTRLIAFGRFVAEQRRARGGGATGDVRFPRLHPHLRVEEERARFSASAQDEVCEPVGCHSEDHGGAATHAA